MIAQIDVPEANLLPLSRAASTLGLSVRQLRRQIAAGAPVALRGSAGRGRATMIWMHEFRAWLEAPDEPARREIEQRAIRRSAFAETLEVVKRTLAEIQRRNVLESYAGVKPWKQEPVLYLLRTLIESCLEAKLDPGPER
ncbi:MAG: hypothetical protein ACREDY_27105 [Bradyrhizobium sp.]